jgi:hypothetical protein
VAYRITKDCGRGWDDILSKSYTAWGVSRTQQALAEKVATGDIFLHYIDHARSWAGYSKVTGHVQENRRDSEQAWIKALPFVIPIECGKWLDEGQCEQCKHAVEVLGLPAKHYERQVTFTSIPASEARLIVEAIHRAASLKQTVSENFHQRWGEGADAYYKRIVKTLANGKCQLCKADAASWAAGAGIKMSGSEVAEIGDAFLDAAHIVPNCDSGPMEPDNARALCPNCHRLIDSLPRKQREDILRRI